AARPSGAPLPTEETQAFIAESRRIATRQRNVLTGTLAAGLVIAMTLAGAALWQREIAVRNEIRAVAGEDQAKQNEAQARAERDRALETQSRFLADLARQRRAVGEVGTAMLLALEALPDYTGGISRPHVPEAELQLDGAMQTLREVIVLGGHEGIVLSAAF